MKKWRKKGKPDGRIPLISSSDGHSNSGSDDSDDEYNDRMETVESETEPGIEGKYNFVTCDQLIGRFDLQLCCCLVINASHYMVVGSWTTTILWHSHTGRALSLSLLCSCHILSITTGLINLLYF